MQTSISTGLLHAIGVTAYVALVALLMQNGERIFGKMNNVAGPIALLLIFVVSATITGVLILGRPIISYLDGQKSEAITLFLSTLGWLCIITFVVLLILAMT